MIAIGNDHSGVELKNECVKYFEANGYEYMDVGNTTGKSCDYPDYAKKVVESILSGKAQKGVLICGTGIGISIAANRYKGIRAALCHDVFSAKAARAHNDANILAMGARVIGIGHALQILKTFFKNEFSNEKRHITRINKIDDFC